MRGGSELRGHEKEWSSWLARWSSEAVHSSCHLVYWAYKQESGLAMGIVSTPTEHGMSLSAGGGPAFLVYRWAMEAPEMVVARAAHPFQLRLR